MPDPNIYPPDAIIGAAIRPNMDVPPSVYSNVTKVAVSPFDFRVVFSEAMVARGENVMTVVDHLSVVMSPPHFKQFVEKMRGQIADYERKFGTILEVEELGVAK
jgi:Protein of unknown function (DUF3467)